MAQPIYLISGSKGGVGKSLFSMAVIDYHYANDKNCILIESDTSNPDVYMCYSELVLSEAINLDVSDGWIELVNLCEENPDSIVIINSAARSNTGITDFGGTLGELLGELDRKLITFWMVDDKKDGAELLLNFMDAMPNSTVHVVRNEKAGNVENFYCSEMLQSGEIKINGQTLSLPILNSKVANHLYNDRLSIEQVVVESTRFGKAKDQKIPMGNRGHMKDWRKTVHKIIEQVI